MDIKDKIALILMFLALCALTATHVLSMQGSSWAFVALLVMPLFGAPSMILMALSEKLHKRFYGSMLIIILFVMASNFAQK